MHIHFVYIFMTYSFTLNSRPVRGNATVEVELKVPGLDTDLPRIKDTYGMVRFLHYNSSHLACLSFRLTESFLSISRWTDCERLLGKISPAQTLLCMPMFTTGMVLSRNPFRVIARLYRASITCDSWGAKSEPLNPDKSFPSTWV